MINTVATSKDYSTSGISGDGSIVSTSGYQSTAATSGGRSTATTSGDYSTAATSGYQSTAETSGNYGTAVTSGYQSTVIATGTNSIVLANGYEAKGRGTIGCRITLTEYSEKHELLDVKVCKVDGENIKSDTFYTLKNGKFVEVKEA